MSGSFCPPRKKTVSASFWTTLTRQIFCECSTCNLWDYRDKIDECNEYPSSTYEVNKCVYTVDKHGSNWWYNPPPPCENSRCHSGVELDYEKGILDDLQQDYDLYRV